MMATVASWSIARPRSTASPSTVAPSAALARPRPMLAAISSPVTPVGYSRADPSGSVIVISGALIVARLPGPLPGPGDDSHRTRAGARRSRAVSERPGRRVTDTLPAERRDRQEGASMASATAELTMSATPDAVWAVLRDFHGLPSWMPGIEKSV